MVVGLRPCELYEFADKARHRQQLTVRFMLELCVDGGVQGLSAGFPCKLASTRANSSCSGKALLKEATIRRTLTVTRAPILSRRQRMVEACARASSVSCSPWWRE